MVRTKTGLDIRRQKVLACGRKICPQDLSNVCRLENIAIETSINAIAFADMRNNITYVNKATLDLFGFKKKQEVLGRQTYEFFRNKKTASNIRCQLIKHGRRERVKEKDGSSFLQDFRPARLKTKSNPVHNRIYRYY
jgi:PAS domain S-box-containing protein